MVTEDGFSCSSSWWHSAERRWSLPRTPRHRHRLRRRRRNTTYPLSLHLAERVAGETALMTRAGWQAIPECWIGTGTLRCGEIVCSRISAHLADQTAVSHGT